MNKPDNTSRHIACDSVEIGQILENLLTKIIEEGGHVHPGLIIKEFAGEFRLECERSADDMKLIELPVECMVPLEHFDLSYQGGQIQLDSVKPEATPLRQELMKLMLLLYNAANKVEAFASGSTEIVFGVQHPIAIALDRFAGTVTQDGYQSLGQYDEVEIHQVKLDQFLVSRPIDSEIIGVGPALMPIVDLINHDTRAGQFDVTERSISVWVTHPVKDSPECFVSYGRRKDNFTLCRHYHFIQQEVDYLCSVPVLLSPAPGLQLRVNRTYNRHLSDAADLIKRLPPGIQPLDGAVSCESMRLSCDDKLDNMRVGMDFMLQLLAKREGFEVTEDIRNALQKTLWQANVDHNHQLLELVAAESVNDRNAIVLTNIKDMVEHNLRLLSDYETRLLP